MTDLEKYIEHLEKKKEECIDKFAKDKTIDWKIVDAMNTALYEANKFNQQLKTNDLTTRKN